MIVGFKFRNFRSYRDTAEFSFEALDDEFNPESVTTVHLNDGSTLRLVNAAVIFGANASGKSNVIYALDTLSQTVKDSLAYTPDRRPLFIIPYVLDQKCILEETEIEIDIVVSGRRFLYKVSGKRKRIITESLDEFINGEWISIFNRRDNNLSIGKELSQNGGFDTQDYATLLKNQLILSRIATRNAEGLQDIANYIANLHIYIGDLHSGSRLDRQNVMENVIKDPNSKLFHQLERLMHIADLGVTGIEAERIKLNLPDSMSDEEKRWLRRENSWMISLCHETDSPNVTCVLNFEAESDGTKSLFGVGARLLAALETGGFIAYDEINDAIHPALLRLLVNLFQSKESNPKGAQLLFSTHDSSVADHDTLRSDQVWFAEKKKGVSELYSAQDFEDVGIRVPFESWYRAGRFGALPSLGDFLAIFK